MPSKSTISRAGIALWAVTVAGLGLMAQSPPLSNFHSDAGKPAATATGERLPEQAAQLHALALALKVEMAKTTTNMLSVKVLRQAQQIEQLAQQMSTAKPASAEPARKKAK